MIRFVKKNVLIKCAMAFTIAIFLSACGNDDSSCTESTWYEDADEDGLGNPDVSISACEQPEGYVSDSSDTDRKSVV